MHVDPNSPEYRDFKRDLEASGLSVSEQISVTNYPWSMGSESAAMVDFMARWRRLNGLPDEHPFAQGVAGGKD